MKLIKERSIAVVFDAVSISKDIEVSGGSLTQNFYAESLSFIPNRFLTPIILTPKVFITDPNGVIENGDKHEELIECTWFEDGEKILGGDEYKLNKDNTLTVLKNSENDFTISYSAIWFDPRKKQNITVEDSVQFVTIALGDGSLQPRITLDKPQNWIHNPLKDERIYSIKAYISTDKVYEGAVEWYYKDKSMTEAKYIDNTMLFYEGGQLTNELKVNSEYLDNCIITAKSLSNEKLKQHYWFFNKDGNPITHEEPEYKDIEGSNVFEVPEEALNTRANYKFEGLTLKNEILGDFSKENSDLNPSNSWFDSSISEEGMLISFKEGEESVQSSMSNITVRDCNKDDIIALVLNAKMISGTSKSLVVTTYNGNIINGESVKTEVGEDFSYVKLAVFTGEDPDSNNLIWRIIRGSSTTSAGDTFLYRYAIAINLTQAFGAGNEPTKEWCDEHITGYFEGVKSVQTPMRVKSVGENLFNIKDAIPNSVLISLTDTGYIKPENSGLGITINLKLKPNIDYKFGYSTIGGSARSLLKDKDNDSTIKPTGMWRNEVVNSGSGNLMWIFSTTSTDMKMKTEVYNIYITENTDIEYQPYVESNLYINNHLELKSIGEVKDYIEDGKLYQNTKRYYFSKEDKWTLRTEYTGDNFRYSMSLPFKYKATGAYVENELICNNFTPASNVTGVYTEKDSNVIALYKENSSTVYLTLDKKVDDVNSVIPEGTFIDVILPEIEVTNLDTSGKLTTYPNGTIFIDYVGKFDSYYMDNIGFKFEGNKEDIVSIKSELDNKYYDINSLKKEDNNYFTHPDIPNGTHLTIEYKTGPEIYGNNTISYVSIKDVLDTLWLEDVYTYKAVLNEDGSVKEWGLVKLVDIENYEEWLGQEKESPYTLAPDGIIFGKYQTDTKFLRQYPSSLYVDFIAPDRLKEGVTLIKARALIGTKDGVVNNPSRFFKITWYKRTLKPGQRDEVLGYGNEILIDVGERDSITIEVEDLGIKKALTDEKGKYLIDENNKIITGR